MTAEAKHPMSRTARPPPGRVLWFEGLFYASVFLSVVRIALEWTSAMGPARFLAIYAFLIAQILLIWLAARRRKNWARWVLLVLFLAWAFTSLLHDGFGWRAGWQPSSIAAQVLKLVQLVLEDIGLILVFTGNARRWFKPHLPHRGHPLP
jgi:hypothetical protein